MMTFLRVRRPAGLLLYCALFVAVVFVTGCDALGDESISLSKEVEFRFEFSTDGRAAGEAFTVASTRQINFDDLLVSEGFTKDEVLLANVRTVVVERVSPAGTNLDVFDRLAFSTTATGLNVPTIAESNNPPSARESAMTLRAPGITEVIWSPSFGGSLTVVPAAAQDEDYVLTVTMDVGLTLEGI